MPAYVSHTIMAKDVYDEIDNKNVDLEYMLTYSLGGDLCKYSKCRYDSHHKLMDEFIYNICDYMKDNNLVNDSECLGFLYGHICHYIMDSEIHPLIRKIDKCCVKNKSKLKSNHTMIELYYDSYLSNKKRNVRIDKYNYKIINAKTNKKICKLIDYVYNKTYNCLHVSRYYKYNLWLYRKIKYLYFIPGFYLMRNISGISKFLTKNKDIDLFNNDHKIEYKMSDGKLVKSDFDTVYNSSVKRAVSYIKKVNEYLKK